LGFVALVRGRIDKLYLALRFPMGEYHSIAIWLKTGKNQVAASDLPKVSIFQITTTRISSSHYQIHQKAVDFPYSSNL
jgi:hypothetical protein